MSRKKKAIISQVEIDLGRNNYCEMPAYNLIKGIVLQTTLDIGQYTAISYDKGIQNVKQLWSSVQV